MEFERSVNTARVALHAGATESAVGELTRALNLWRGPAFDCVPRSPAIEAYAIRLDEAHVAAQESLIATRLSLGQHAEVVPDLVGLTAAHPHRESLHRHLMTALHRTGRRLDALDVFLRLHFRLAADYGLEPDRQTAELHQALLRDCVDVAAAPGGERPHAGPTPPRGRRESGPPHPRASAFHGPVRPPLEIFGHA
nr:AfsR/SARP family transcriptional regulator [Nonomuraea diastatica]